MIQWRRAPPRKSRYLLPLLGTLPRRAFMDSSKVCPGCSGRFPVSEFRHREGAGSRRSMCGPCCRQYHKEYRLRGREGRVTRFLSSVSRSRRTRATLRLVTEMSRCFGGPERLAQAWFDSIEAARRSRPGSLAVLRSYSAIMKLAALVCEPREPDHRQATEEEIQALIDERIVQVVDRCLAERFGLGDPLVDPDSPAADREAEPDEDTTS
jgi:hypothetical protein